MKNILIGAVVLLISVALFFTSVTAIANTASERTQIDPASLVSEGIGEIIYEFSQEINVKPLIQPVNPRSAVLISEGFEGAWVPDPEGDGPPYMVPVDPNFAHWDIDGLCVASQSTYPGLTHYWSDFTPSDHPNSWPFPHAGSFCAGIWWSDGTGGETTQDEWLITPEMDTSKYSDMQLTFYSVYNMMRGGTNPTYNNYVKYSTDGGITWSIIGDLNNDPQYDFNGCTGGPLADPNWNWNEVQIVLPLPNAKSLMIAWNYVWDGTGSAYIWMVDDIEIIAKKAKDLFNPADLCEVDVSLMTPRVKQISNPAIVRILERFQIAFPILRQLLRL